MLDWVQKYGTESVSTNDEVQEMTIDSTGNIYVAGMNYGSTGIASYTTIKYSPDGSEIWRAIYQDDNYGLERVKGLCVDQHGNVFVLGTDHETEDTTVYTTIRYNPDGSEAWVVKYRGPGYWNRAEAMAIDGRGNIIVTGRSEDPGSDGDYATIKYNSAGVELWVARYSGPASQWDGAYAVAVDSSDNVYVAGSSGSTSSGTDIVTIKYTSEGDEVWVARYNGPANADDHGDCVSTDALGNVYVLGGRDLHYSNSYVLIKYNSDGSEAWVRSPIGYERDCKRSMKLDNVGNIYITGASEESNSNNHDDFLTIKYTPDGNEVWRNRYNGPDNGRDDAQDLAVDAYGSVYVVGYSEVSNGDGYNYALVKYDSTGNTLWTMSKGGGHGITESVSLDFAGNILITGNLEGDYTTVKYAPDGDELWTVTYEGEYYSVDVLIDMQVDDRGNSYLTGGGHWFWGSISSSTIHLNSNGSLEWENKHSIEQGHIVPRKIVHDDNGNSYVAGSWSTSDGDSSGYYLKKIDQDGTEIWEQIFSSLNGWAYLADLGIDPAGNIYLTGYSEGDTTFTVTAKYDQNGVEVWMSSSKAPVQWGYVRNIAVDASGCAYITGVNSHQDGLNLYILKYDEEGNADWISIIAGDTISYADPIAMILDPENNIYITGLIEVDGRPADILTAKYSSSGDELWSKIYQSATDQYDMPTSIGLDQNGNVIVTGWTEGEGGPKIITLKYFSDGSVAWVNEFQGSESGWYYETAMDLDDMGNMYVVSQVTRDYDYWRTGLLTEMVLVKYNSSGEQAWIEYYDDPKAATIWPVHISVGAEGDIYIGARAGSFFSSSWWPYWASAEYAVIKYSQPGYPVSADQVLQPNEFKLSQNYPNPFNPRTTLFYSIPEMTDLKLTIYDVLGRTILIHSELQKQIGEYEFTWDGVDQQGLRVPTGVYFARLDAGEFSQTIKMLLLK